MTEKKKKKWIFDSFKPDSKSASSHISVKYEKTINHRILVDGFFSW